MTNTQGSDTESTRDELAKWLARHDNKYAWSKMTRGEKNEQVDFTKYTSGYKELISLFNTHLDQQIAEALEGVLDALKNERMEYGHLEGAIDIVEHKLHVATLTKDNNKENV